MEHVVLLIAQSESIEDDNYLRFGNELLRRGYRVDLCFLETIAMHDSNVVARGFTLTDSIEKGGEFPASQMIRLADANILWILTLGMRHSFLDKVQLLHCLEQDCRIINSLTALMHFKSKYFLASQTEINYPKTYASNDPAELFSIIESGNHKWIAKPPAGSLGRDIFLLTADDPNARVILESMTGPEADQYCLLQPYIDEILKGEKRILFAGGVPIGQYLRLPGKDHRTNILHGAEIQSCELTAEELDYCKTIGNLLINNGADFVGLDMAYPYVIEFNVVNPGGLLTIESLTGNDLTANAVDHIFSS